VCLNRIVYETDLERSGLFTRVCYRELMVRSTLVILFLYAAAQGSSDIRLNGVWTINRSLSEFPREVAFTPAWLDSAASAGGAAGRAGGAGGSGGRGGRGSRGGGSSGGSSGPVQPVRESADDAARVRVLTSEVRNPPARLTIVDEAAAVTISDEGGSRTFHPTGRPEALATTTSGLPDMIVTTRREGDRLVVTYNVEEGHQLRYTYSTSANPRQLIVDIEFVEKSGGDRVHRVYDQGRVQTTTPAAPGAGAAASAPAAPGLRGLGAPPSAPAVEKFDQRPDAEFKGLTTLGLVVEELSPQAASCGLNHDTIDNDLFKRLTDAGFTVKRHSDDDTYVYVNIMTTSANGGLCVSRYDVFLYSHTTARLTHTTMPVLVQAELLHSGGIAGGAAASHAAAVTRGLDGYVDEFAARIRGANGR